MLISEATGGSGDDQDYQILRLHFVEKPNTKDLLPAFVRTNRDLSQFWQFIKYEFGKYAERRNYIYTEFVSLLDYLEGNTSAPSDTAISDGLKNFDEGGVHSV